MSLTDKITALQSLERAIEEYGDENMLQEYRTELDIIAHVYADTLNEVIVQYSSKLYELKEGKEVIWRK